MKKVIIILFLLCAAILYAETFQFHFIDSQERNLQMAYNYVPLEERPVAEIQWYNYSEFLIDQFDFDYETGIACIAHSNETIDGRVEFYSDVLYFYPDDILYVNDRYLIKIEFRFYGISFRYDLELEEKLSQVDVGTFWMEHDIIDKWELWKYDWIYQRETYKFDGYYERVRNISP